MTMPVPRSAAALASQLCGAILLTFLSFGAAAQERRDQAHHIAYSVKFLCGPSSENFQEGMVTGRAATSISILNPSTAQPVSFSKRVSRALPYQTPGDISPSQNGSIGPLEAITVECDEIRQMLPSQMTTEFRTGYLSLVAEAQLIVTVAYSARPHGGEVSTLDVETIEGTKLAKPPDEKELADLIVKDIDIGKLRNRCPSGQGSCIASVPVTVANIGTGDAGPFRLRVLFDPAQSTIVDRDLPGLAAGTSSTVIITTGPSDNCFDPDCTICAFADHLDAVAESNEANNSLCRSRQG